MRPAFDLSHVDLLEKQGSNKGGGSKHSGHHEPEQPVSQGLRAGPMPPQQPGGAVISRKRLRGAFQPKQTQKDRDQQQRYPGPGHPKQPPVNHGQKRHEQDRQQGFGGRKAQPGDGQGPPREATNHRAMETAPRWLIMP